MTGNAPTLLTVAVPEIWNILEIQKNENLLRSPKFHGEYEFPVEMCKSQLITEILSFFCFHKNFIKCNKLLQLTVAVPEIWNILEIQKMVEKNARTVLKFQSLF